MTITTLRSLSVFFFAPPAFLCLSAMSQDLRDTRAAQQACGPSAVRFDKGAGLEEHPVLGEVPQGKALIYLVQIQGTPATGHLQFTDRGTITKFGVDGQWRGATWGNSLLSTQVEPGDHHLCVAWNEGGPKKLEQVVALRSLHAEAGRTYVYGVRLLVSGISYSFDFVPLDPDEAAMLLGSYPLSKLKPKP